MDFGLTGRIALVGGASSGLCRASASALAAEGCRLAIWSRGRDALAGVAADLRERYGTEVTILEGRECLRASHVSSSSRTGA